MYNLGSNQMHEGIKLFIFVGNCFSGGNEPKNGGGDEKITRRTTTSERNEFLQTNSKFQKKRIR